MNNCTNWIVRLTVVGLVGSAALAQGQEKPPLCGDEVKKEVAAKLAANKADGPKPTAEAMAYQKVIYEQLKYCKQDVRPLDPGTSFCATVPFAGNTFYETMPCCGYDPQKQQFACTIDVHQRTGFNPQPPGSYLNVLTCVKLGGSFVEVARDSVHLADSTYDPKWFFAVIAKATGLSQLPLTGKEYDARSILEWSLHPVDCNYSPVWGNALDYKIRLDP